MKKFVGLSTIFFITVSSLLFSASVHAQAWGGVGHDCMKDDGQGGYYQPNVQRKKTVIGTPAPALPEGTQVEFAFVAINTEPAKVFVNVRHASSSYDGTGGSTENFGKLIDGAPANIFVSTSPVKSGNGEYYFVEWCERAYYHWYYDFLTGGCEIDHMGVVIALVPEM